MPLVTSNYGDGLLCIGFERPDISAQSCQTGESPPTFVCPPWSSSSNRGFEEGSRWLLPEALALALHFIPGSEGN